MKLKMMSITFYMWFFFAASISSFVHSDVLQGAEYEHPPGAAEWQPFDTLGLHRYKRDGIVRRQSDLCSSHSNNTFIEPAECAFGGKEFPLCQPGEVKIAKCIKIQSKVCSPCLEQATYMPSPNDCTECLPCRTCGTTEQVIEECTLTSDRQCGPTFPTTDFTITEINTDETLLVPDSTASSAGDKVVTSERMIDILVATTTLGTSTVSSAGEYIMLPKLVFFVVVGILSILIIVTMLCLVCWCCKYKRIKQENNKLRLQLQENGIHDADFQGKSNGNTSKKGYTQIHTDDIEMTGIKTDQKTDDKNRNQNGNTAQVHHENEDDTIEIAGSIEPPYAQVNKHGKIDASRQPMSDKMAASGQAPLEIPVLSEEEEEKEEQKAVAVDDEPPYDWAEIPLTKVDAAVDPPYDRADVSKGNADPPYDNASMPSKKEESPYDNANMPSKNEESPYDNASLPLKTADSPYDEANIAFDMAESGSRNTMGRIGSTSSDDPPPLPERNKGIQRSYTVGSSPLKQSQHLKKGNSNVDRSYRNNAGLESQPILPNSPVIDSKNDKNKKKSRLRRFLPGGNKKSDEIQKSLSAPNSPRSSSAPNSPTDWQLDSVSPAPDGTGHSSEQPAAKTTPSDVKIEDLYAKVDKSRKRTPPAGSSKMIPDSDIEDTGLAKDLELQQDLATNQVDDEGPYATSNGPDASDLQVDSAMEINGSEGLQEENGDTSRMQNTDKLATDLDFDKVANHLTPDMLRSLYRHLGLDKPTIERAEADCHSGLTVEKAIAVLQAWRSREGKKATQKVIIEALRRGQHNESADALVDAFCKEGSEFDRETCI